MFKHIRDSIATIFKEIASVYFPSVPHPINVTNRSIEQVEREYETNAARELLKKDTRMKVARILTRM